MKRQQFSDRRRTRSGLVWLTAFTLWGCQQEAEGPPLVPVPEQSGTQAPMAPTGQPAGGEGPALPADHPPIPSAQQPQLPADHPPIPSAQQPQLPADHPPIPTAQPAGLPANHPQIPPAGSPGQAALGTAPTGGLQWAPPTGWVEQPPASSMRLAQWQIGGSLPSGAAECAVLRFSGGGGSVTANLDRWIGQFTQPDGSSSADRAIRGEVAAPGLQITTLELTGTFETRSPPMTGPVVEVPNQAMFGAIIDTPEGPYFLKCTGPEATMTAEREPILTFLRTLSMPGI